MFECGSIGPYYTTHATLWGGWEFPQLVINAVAIFCVVAQLSGL